MGTNNESRLEKIFIKQLEQIVKLKEELETWRGNNEQVGIEALKEDIMDLAEGNAKPVKERA